MTEPGPQDRPENREVENEELRPGADGEPPRPAREPPGGRVPPPEETMTDPATGEPND